ncbi:MAG: orotate phosphoribosyltransferase [Bacillota bacterium]|jgi:orotate phosphoribosyltransferase
MLKQEQILDIFYRTGALMEGHFRLTSGRHSDQYIQCARVLQHPDHTILLCREIVRDFLDQDIEAVVGPAMGGIVLAYEAARQLGARALFAERENGVMTLRRGFSLDPGQKALVLEDVITTGGSVMEVVQMLQKRGVQVVGIGCLVKRSKEELDLGAPLRALLTVEIKSYLPEECPLCREGVPLTKPGSREV